MLSLDEEQDNNSLNSRADGDAGVMSWKVLFILSLFQVRNVLTVIKDFSDIYITGLCSLVFPC